MEKFLSFGRYMSLIYEHKTKISIHGTVMKHYVCFLQRHECAVSNKKLITCKKVNSLDPW